MDSSMFEELSTTLERELIPKGFEIHPFLIGWYNEKVKDIFRLNYDDQTLAFVVISTPDMFEETILPFVSSTECDFAMDPVDSSVKKEIQNLKTKLDSEFDVLHDFEVDQRTRRPRILVQTAGHVAGAARYYQRTDVVDQPWPESKPVYGVSVHPKYGGWFALRCVLIFKNILHPRLDRREPLDIVVGDSKRIELLEKFSFSWQDWTYRDVVPVEKRYSEKQKEYFKTLPSDRKELICKWISADAEPPLSG